jgi:hypothetical protein
MQTVNVAHPAPSVKPHNNPQGYPQIVGKQAAVGPRLAVFL